MRRYADLATGVRLSLTLTLGVVLAAVVPSTLTVESPSTMVVASLALALLAIVGVATLVAVPSLFAPGYPLAETAEAPLHQPGRVTDPGHHQIRPRAPGC